MSRSLMTACRFKHTDVAVRLLERSIALDPELGRRIDRWQSRNAFVEFLAQQPGLLWKEPEMGLWETFVLLQLASARDRNDLSAFRHRIGHHPGAAQPAL